jgi:hypothetical protein
VAHTPLQHSISTGELESCISHGACFDLNSFAAILRCAASCDLDGRTGQDRTGLYDGVERLASSNEAFSGVWDLCWEFGFYVLGHKGL